MANWEVLLQKISEQDADHKDPDYVTPATGFPLPKMYRAQGNALTELLQLKSAVLSPHTGFGKTPLFLTVAHNRSALIIEPRKFLQKQVASYCNDTILFGRSEYPCYFADNASNAPCTRKMRCDRTDFGKTCEHKTRDCQKNPCKVFFHDEKLMRYPCISCPYNNAVALAMGVIRHGGKVICNFGNFWKFLPEADLVIIDEADLFFKEISSPEPMRHTRDLDVPILTMLRTEMREIEKQMQTCEIRKLYALKNRMYRLSFLEGVSDLCFTYKKRNLKTKTESIYVEVNPANVNLLKDQIFGNKQTIVVSATPGDFNLPSVGKYSIHQRCKIYYTPVGKLTSRELERQPWLLDHAADFIDQASAIFGGLYGSKKFVVHCGNLGNHAAKINTMLNDIEKKDVCTLHASGKLMETIDTFMAGDKKFLLVASAEYGADFTWCNCQFILKFPYASLDDRLKALEKKLGKDAFKEFYTLDAVNRFVQQCGRVGRGWDSFGCTFILDAKFGEIWKRYNRAFPEWFKERMVDEAF